MTACIQTRLDRYRTRNVPRYTSYPTAPHFHKGFGTEAHARALAALDPAEPISLYLHVPFCRHLCWYCGCNMKLASREAPIAQYAQMLRQEIDLLASHLPAKMRISHLHWGGGTPTALLPQDLAMLMRAVGDRFQIEPDAELAIESDPRSLSDEMIAMIGALGFNRASFGVQEFDPRVQAAINRIQPPEMVRRAVDGLRAAGVKGINFDLIYGLPHQTTETLLETIRLCEEIGPDRIALFGYAHVPWMAKKQRLIDEAALPGAEARQDQANAASHALQAAGFTAIGLDHFARAGDALAQAAEDGTLRRNFQGYTTDRATTMLCVGTTSIGRTPRSYSQNLSETGAWARAISEGRLPVGRGLALTDDDLLRGEIIERLMCQGRVNPAAVAAAHGQSATALADAEPALAELEADGLIVRDASGLITATPLGRPLIRVIASAFDAYLATQKARHAVAV
ncbi:oxygen-independent coproporphyrinogen III oxidase [Jannaschia seohaensis]|uniref:Coproporphyrinogen-III oxidase n=1 Tax=Jannaschia seohaensis TaxID=475081 RepID=A0A2Y9APH6_9RHOB|nr:oxygen-independent coproporphyrinogen III oxidase [Jannaschia seohaensis]PWJ19334.1 oxygen-independent coproporphyrinogen-3 oxidase [Jannaschia seohaensis]SSA45996.1 oxygen-independent coproporphyrinogen-3 oxidase [Jannaschia seohaensis]